MKVRTALLLRRPCNPNRRVYACPYIRRLWQYRDRRIMWASGRDDGDEENQLHSLWTYDCLCHRPIPRDFACCFTLISLRISADWLSLLIKISMALGSGILLFLILLLMVELRQDKRINRYYEHHRNRKLQIANTVYECQACGNRKLSAGDTCCAVCGSRFQA